MSQITINIGTVANDGTGDTLRGAFSNTNSNFTELYSHNTNVVSNLVSVAVGANAWSNSVGTAGNNYINAVGLAGNNYTNSVGIAGNNYAIQVGAASNTWANLNFTTIANGSLTYNHANLAFDKANNSLQNTTIYLNGVFNDTVGPLRSKFLVASNTNNGNFIVISDTIYTSNTSVDAYYDIFDDSLINVSVGSHSTIINLGTGKTIIRPNGSVSVFSANGLNLVSQYAVADIYKVAANTWVAAGNLSNA